MSRLLIWFTGKKGRKFFSQIKRGGLILLFFESKKGTATLAEQKRGEEFSTPKIPKNRSKFFRKCCCVLQYNSCLFVTHVHTRVAKFSPLKKAYWSHFLCVFENFLKKSLRAHVRVDPRIFHNDAGKMSVNSYSYKKRVHLTLRGISRKETLHLYQHIENSRFWDIKCNIDARLQCSCPLSAIYLMPWNFRAPYISRHLTSAKIKENK